MENKKSMGKFFEVASRLLYKVETYYNAIANILISHLYYSLMWSIVVKGTESQGYEMNISETSNQKR